MTLEAEPFLDWTFGKRDQKPTFENKVGDDRHTKRHGCHCQPVVFTEPSHEPPDEDDRGDIQTDKRHRADIDCGGYNDTHNLTKLSPLCEQSVVLFTQPVPEIDRAGSDNEDPEVEWNKSGARALGAP